MDQEAQRQIRKKLLCGTRPDGSLYVCGHYMPRSIPGWWWWCGLKKGGGRKKWGERAAVSFRSEILVCT
eukprot:2692363-Pleurochrysis_carterae.AAC.2